MPSPELLPTSTPHRPDSHRRGKMGATWNKMDKAMDSVSDGDVMLVLSTRTIDDLKQKSANTLVVLEFYSPWSQPCKYMEEAFKELAKDFVGQARFYKLNVDTFEQFARSCGVEALPTFVLMRNGHNVETVVGINKEALRNTIQRALNRQHIVFTAY